MSILNFAKLATRDFTQATASAHKWSLEVLSTTVRFMTPGQLAAGATLVSLSTSKERCVSPTKVYRALLTLIVFTAV